MKKITLVVVLLMVLTLAGCSRFDFGTTGEYIISAKDALKLVENNEAILLDVSSATDYATSHIENAINVPYTTLLVDEPYESTIADENIIESVMGAAGIKETDKVVLYDRNCNMQASRVLWTLNMYGNFNAKVISGGYEALLRVDAKTTTLASTLPQAVYNAGEKQKKLIVSLDYLKVIMTEENTVIIDARAASEVALGKIPGAINVDYKNNNYVNGEFQSIKNIQLIYLKKGVSVDTKIIIYCKSGVRASQTYVALKNAGFTDVRVYDGSWVEYFDVEAPAAPSGGTAPTTPPSGGCGG